MKLREMIDIVKEKSPSLGTNQIVKMINRAMDDFTRQTEILDSSFTIDDGLGEEGTSDGIRYYELVDNIIKIKSIDVNDETAPMLVGRPEIRDIT